MKEGKLSVAQQNEEENKLCWDENEWKKESWKVAQQKEEENKVCWACAVA